VKRPPEGGLFVFGLVVMRESYTFVRLRGRHRTGGKKADGIAAGTSDMLKQHYVGQLRITDVREMSVQMKGES
jgi:hypothetical protein